ncbi:unnamed protein product [Eruca vesicaria subsp. sativa]|uniref:NYN domain-containing protein n=1 Tax=Eruca vesicaria subsp. sativa TaxID=29727 RepID=A0ABC8K5H7_ERUVS|nr:unnamed protein product [Eruca vesicaria subsp. sativa]
MDVFSAPYDRVFWDFDECEIPEELNAPEVLQRMKQMSTALDKGHRGPVSFRAYGDMTGLDFQSSEIKLNHFHSGEKREKMTKMLVDIVAWSGENAEPSVGILVLGDLGATDDADFAEVVDLLQTQKSYQFVIVSPGSPPPPPPPTMVMILPAIPRGGL